MAAKNDLATAQEAFYSALKRSADTVSDMRLARTGRRGGTGEMPPMEPSAEMMGRATLAAPLVNSKRRRTPSQMRVRSALSDNDLQATLLLIKRLRELGDKDESAEIVCLDADALRNHRRDAKYTCKGLQSFWIRAGRTPPTVRYASAPLSQALETRPVAVFMDPAKAPQQVEGYIRVIMDEPYVCMLLREE